MEATRRATDDLVRVMASNPKFRESEFFDFMSKISDGELAFENNTVVETGVKVCNLRVFVCVCVGWTMLGWRKWSFNQAAKSRS